MKKTAGNSRLRNGHAPLTDRDLNVACHCFGFPSADPLRICYAIDMMPRESPIALQRLIFYHSAQFEMFL